MCLSPKNSLVSKALSRAIFLKRVTKKANGEEKQNSLVIFRYSKSLRTADCYYWIIPACFLAIRNHFISSRVIVANSFETFLNKPRSWDMIFIPGTSETDSQRSRNWSQRRICQRLITFRPITFIIIACRVDDEKKSWSNSTDLFPSHNEIGTENFNKRWKFRRW